MKRYLRDKKEIRFGRRSLDVASIGDLCVDLELHEEQASAGVGVDEVAGKGRLGSYHELFSISDHVLLFGRAGTGKTTLISKMAYDWAKHVKDGNNSHEVSQTRKPALSAMELVFVLDIRTFQNDQTLAEAIKRQLLPSASLEDIDEVLECLETNCLLLLDGFDELPKSIRNCPLDSPHLSYLSVIATTRPHMRDKFCRKYSRYTLVLVSGFSKANVVAYITKFFEIMNKPELASTLVERVKGTPLLQNLSSFPGLLVMICLLWEDTRNRDATFHSMTCLYREAVSKQYLNRPFQDKEGPSGREIQHVLESIGKVALDELLQDNVQIAEDKFEANQVLEQAVDMGLLVRSEGKLVDDNSVTFVHKTFQEYCAAVYLISLVDKDVAEFELYLKQVNRNNVYKMDYLLRFSCGLNSKAADAILTHILQLKCERYISYLGNQRKKLVLTMLYEADLSHGSKVKGQQVLHMKLQSSGVMGKEVAVSDAEFLAGIIHFTSKGHADAKDTWLREIKVLTVTCCFPSVLSMMQALGGMNSLHSACVCVDASFNGIKEGHRLRKGGSDGNPMISSESLKEFKMSGSDKVITVDVISLLRVSSYMPALTKVVLENIQLSGELDDDPLALTKALKQFTMISSRSINPSESDKSSNVKVSLLACLLSRMPALTQISLVNVQLTGLFNGNPAVLSESLKNFKMSGGSCDMMVLKSLLRCMPKLTNVSLDVRLTEDMDDILPTLNDTLKKHIIESRLRDVLRVHANREPCLPQNLQAQARAFLVQILEDGTAESSRESLRSKGTARTGEESMSASVPVSLHKERLKGKSGKDTNIPGDFSQVLQSMSHLKRFSLHDCGLQAKHYKTLGSHLSSLKDLEEICISGTDSQNVMPMFDHDNVYPSNLATLRLSGTNLTDEEIAKLPWTKLTKVTEIDLHQNIIGPDGAVILAKSLHHIPSLRGLNLASNSITSDGASVLAQSFQHTPAMQMLKLASNGIGPDGISALAKSFQHTPELQVLDLAINRIGSEGASALAESFQHCRELQDLNLSGNSIGSEGASGLAHSLHFTQALQHLDLAINRIGSGGASELARSFQHCTRLQELNLAGNTIGSDGASAIAEAIENTPGLEHLNLAGNDIGPDGALALAKTFIHLGLLKSLDLSWNKGMGPQGLDNLFTNLIHLPHLEELDLQYIPLSEEECSAYPVLLDCCKTLHWDFDKSYRKVLSSDEIRLVCDVVRNHQR